MINPTISLIINNKPYDVRANASILQACEDVGIHLPRFCYHEKLSVAGNCRICLVEVEKSPKPVVSCAMPVAKGMVIYTDTPLVKKVRESVLEFLLINHPLDCPICDQGGECDLQDQTLEYASDRGRFYEFKRSVEDKEVGPIIKTIMTRCIHCTRCVRFSTEIAGQEVMGAFARGEETEIGTYVQEFIKTELSGNLADICPVGALTSKPYAYKTRSWELQKVESIDFFDALCADVSIQTRKATAPTFNSGNVNIITKEEIVRILPRTNGMYADNWISDKTRYAFDGLRNQRLRQIKSKNLIKGIQNPSFAEILLELKTYLSGNVFNTNTKDKNKPLNIALIADSLLDLESLYILNETMKFYGANTIEYGNSRTNINFDTPNFYTLNRKFSALSELNTLLMIGLNTRFESSLLNTSLRKQQISRDLSYITIGAYSDLKLKQNHLGLNPKTIISLIENKTNITKLLVNTKMPSVFLGVEILKGKNGFILQNLSRFLAKRLFLKTKNEERLGYVHANTTSLIFNSLGISSGVRSPINVTEIEDKKINLLFAIQPFTLKVKKWISAANYTHIFAFATHKPTNLNYDRLLPMKSLYEKDGYLVNIEGRIRKFYKSLTSPEKILSLESFFTTLLRAHGGSSKTKWLITLAKVWRFNDEVMLDKNLEKVNNIYPFFFFNISEGGFIIDNAPFAKTLSNFYQNDLLSANSLTMGEASLFLRKGRNFS